MTPIEKARLTFRHAVFSSLVPSQNLPEVYEIFDAWLKANVIELSQTVHIHEFVMQTHFKNEAIAAEEKRMCRGIGDGLLEKGVAHFESRYDSRVREQITTAKVWAFKGGGE